MCSGSETSDMAILLSVVFGLLVYPIHVAGLTLCDTDGTLEVVESKASNAFTCTGAGSTYTVTWILQRSNENPDLATCIPASCNNPYKPRFEASRPAGDRSTLTVNGSTTSYLQYIQGQTIVCRTNPRTGGSPQQTQCTVDVVAVPSVTCDAHYNTGTSSPGTVTGNCSVSGAYSYLNRYTCKLIQTSPTTKSLGSGNLTVTSTSGSGGKYTTGYCQVTVPYPDVNGVYSYKMAVTPGRQDVPASFGGQSSLEIKRPSTPPSHDCPQYVGESQGTSCTCTATDLGQPAGVVRWTSTMTNQLSLSNVNKDYNGATYTCDVIWNGQRTQSVTYTLRVASPPSTPAITKPNNDYPPIATVTQSATLTCHSAPPGVPISTYTWPITQGGRQGTDGQGRGTLTFDTISKELDGKTASCRAKNWFTDNITTHTVPDGTFTLEVYYKPEISTQPVADTDPNQCEITSSDKSQCLVTEGQRVHIRCSASSNPQPADITWQGHSGNDPDLLIESADHTQHTGTYNCSVTTGRGNHGNDPRLPLRGFRLVTVLVTYLPSVLSTEVNSSAGSTHTVNSNGLLNLSCRAVGRPPPEMKLIHPNKTLIARTPQGSPSVADTPSVVSGKLTARCRDTGIYTCTADNTVGSAQQQTFSIFVQCKPETPKDAGDASIPPVNYRTEAVQLNFRVTAYPVPELKEVKFFKQKPNDTADGQAAEEGTVAVKCFPDSTVSANVTCQVTVDNIKSSYAGFYQAFVGNDFGNLTLEFEVRVNATYIDPEAPGFPVGAVVGVIVTVLVVSAIIVVVVLGIRRQRARKHNAASASLRRNRNREEPDMIINDIYEPSSVGADGDDVMITNTAYVSAEDAAPQRNQPSTSRASSSPYKDVDVPNAKPVIKPKPKPKPYHGASAAQVATTDDVYATVNKKNGPQSAPEDSSPVYAVVNKKKKAPAELPTATPGTMNEKPNARKKPAPEKLKQKEKGKKQTKKGYERARDPAPSTSSGAVYGNVTPLSMSPPEPEGYVYDNFGFQRDGSVESDHKPEPEPEGSRTVNPDGLVYVTIGFSEEQLKKAKDPPPEHETTAYAELDFSKM